MKAVPDAGLVNNVVRFPASLCGRMKIDVYKRQVFNFAGVNRPDNPDEFMQGNFGFGSKLLDTLKNYHNTCPVMLSSSIQASLEGRYAGSEYGKSKLAGENLFKAYGEETGSRVLIYRFPNLFGKWCRPNYNSAVATFCNNIANGLPIQVNDRNVRLDLVYIDDLMEEMFRALDGKEHRDENGYGYVPEVHQAALGEIVDLLYEFRAVSYTHLDVYKRQRMVSTGSTNSSTMVNRPPNTPLKSALPAYMLVAKK